jgi:hypothetical protein
MMTIEHKFVDLIPDKIPYGILFICIRYKTAVHQCVCGCGNEVVTPISPTDWQISFDGQSVSLHPSIGNWNFPCRSHYWIAHNTVYHSNSWSEEEVKTGREKDQQKKKLFFKKKKKEKKNLNK